MLKKNGLGITLMIFLMIFMVGCVDNSNENVKEQEERQNEVEYIEETEEYTPSEALPEGIPVYPGAILWGDTPSQENWQWLYTTTGSGNEIVDFFTRELTALGFAIDDEYTFTYGDEFFISTKDGIIGVYWLGDEAAKNATPDTPNRGYGIIVDVEAWENR